jgi:small-conductance mechanosensitive channel
MDVLTKSLFEEWHHLLKMLPRIAIAVIVLLIFVWLGRMIGRGLVRFLEKGKFSPSHKKFVQAGTTWMFVLIGLIVALNVIGLKGLAASLLAGGGVSAVLLGFAFREIGENLLSGILLAFNRPFEIGDFVQSEDLKGEVRGIELRHTHIRTVDGTDIFIPSSQIIKKPLINFTKSGLRRPSFIVGVDYQDDVEKARHLLLEVVQRTEGVLSDPAPTVIISSFAPHYVELEVVFWVDTAREGVSLPQVRSLAMERCRRSLLKLGFTLSSQVSRNVEIGGRRPVDLRVMDRHSLEDSSLR